MHLQVGFHEIKNVYSKGNNHQGEETVYRMGENISNYTLDQGLIS